MKSAMMRVTFYSIIGIILSIALNLFESSALAFENVKLPKESHPFVYFKADEIDEVKSRLEREPYKSWYKSLVSRTDRYVETFDPGSHDGAPMLKAKELAFRYWIENDEYYAEKAVEYLLEFQDEPQFTQLDNSPIRYARVLFDACAAYDMLHGYLRLRPELDYKLRNKIAKGAQASHDFMPIWYARLKNNWGIRQYSGLGIAALTFADGVDGYDPEKWWHKSEMQLKEHFEFQVTPVDGAWCEGYAYIAYSGDLYLPYFHARFRATGDNLFKNELINKAHRWAIDVLVPNGYGPMFDDSTHSRFQFEQLTRHTENPEMYRWAYLRSDGTAAGINFVDAISNYDDSPAPQEPDSPPSRYLYDAGNMVFRSGWDSDAVYALFLGEHGPANSHGGGHEHPDVTSFQIFAYGNWYFLDSGYGGWNNRARTNKPEDHNLILVDGMGPDVLKLFGHNIVPMADGEITDYERSDRYERCTIRTSYQICDINRHVYFVDGDTFILFDTVSSDFERDYTWLYHLNAGYETGAKFIAPDNGAIIERDDVRMYLSLYSLDNPMELKTRSGEHAFRNNVFNDHTVREAHLKADKARMLTVIHFSKKENMIPTQIYEKNGKIEISTGNTTFELDISTKIPSLIFPVKYSF